ncbi:hypothetical protein J7T55_003258 [Diaporthe amygdali]|uniref:uncharacterized protein n=1 Tax=Phomopsis amygdali TaxID=1214568 RepID=UPI0022FE7356|nr:uncharacterized protein J7T55_003258 [Diaporthe amygdali]KAJ0122742.1 hypothetical protein J7T55_003258 [Diaporthe amygdali]
MMVSSFHDGPSQASAVPGMPMHMPIPMEGFHTVNAEPSPSVGPNYQYSQHHQQQQSIRRKRKADSQDANNERLSKRLSLLNLEQNGSKLYVPVEQPPAPQFLDNAGASSSSAAAVPAGATAAGGDEMMLLDDTKHKVYIYNLDDELSSDADSDPDEARLVFLPDVEKHLKANRIIPGIPSVPRPVLPNKDGELAGMQLVLYDDGVRSVSVPEEQDSVRKAIIEARERHRRRQQDERDARAAANNPLLRRESRATFATPVRVAPVAAAREQRQPMVDDVAGMASAGAGADDDADAMEID